MILLAALPALAIDLSRASGGLSVGLETVINDPFVYRRGLRLGGHFAPAPWVEIGTALVYYPVLGRGGEGDPDWTPLSEDLFVTYNVSPDIAKVTAQAQANIRIVAVRPELGGGWRAGLGILAGVGLFQTEDDLWALQEEGVESAEATQGQVHAGMVAGLFWEVRRERVGVRVRLERDGYIETIDSYALARWANHLLGAEVLWWF